VVSTTVGYTGGKFGNPTYETVCGGDGHTEAIRIEYDPAQISYEELLEEFYKGHTPYASKAQYKSAIWFHDEEQRKAAEEVIQTKSAEKGYEVPTDLEGETEWYDAEGYHQKYYTKKGCSVM